MKHNIRLVLFEKPVEGHSVSLRWCFLSKMFGDLLHLQGQLFKIIYFIKRYLYEYTIIIQYMFFFKTNYVFWTIYSSFTCKTNEEFC
jgi:hypothetical protein